MEQEDKFTVLITAIAKMEQRLEHNTELLREIKATAKEDRVDFDSRVKDLESKVNKAAAVIGFITFIIGLVGHKVLELFKGA